MRRAVALSCFWLICLLILLRFQVGPAFGQSDLDGVHIDARVKAPPVNVGATLLSVAKGPASIKKNVELVLVPVTITDGMDRVVTGLVKGDFEIFDGKKRQEIRHFSSEDEPISIGIIFDSSGSMKTKMDRAREAVHRFCESANLEDEFFMIAFNDSPELVADLTTKPEEIENKLLFVAPKGQTSLVDAVYMGLQKMKQVHYQRRTLLIISDGGDNHSRYTEGELFSLVKEADVMIYGVGIFDRQFHTFEEARGPELLSIMAESTGGRAFTVDNPNILPEIAAKVGAELRNQYVLGYQPDQAARDGKWHKIRVKLAVPRKFSFLRVHNKPGYYAPKD